MNGAALEMQRAQKKPPSLSLELLINFADSAELARRTSKYCFQPKKIKHRKYKHYKSYIDTVSKHLLK